MLDKKWFLIFFCWVFSTISTLGSLFFSHVMGLPPCSLCWYQRILMYPLVIMFFTALIFPDRGILKYSFPLGFIGWLIAIYHNLLYYKILPESASPCIQGISCTTVQLQWLGFITIPLLSLFGFSLILTTLVLLNREYNLEK
jgi:disulfide bond formation protein DsbB